MLRVVLPLVLVFGLVRSPPLAAQAPLTGRTALDILRSEARRAAELLDRRWREEPLSRTEVYHGVWLRESGGADSVVFDFLPFATAPRVRDGVAIAFDPGLGTRMWAGAAEPDLLRSALQGTAARVALSAWRAFSPAPGAPLAPSQPCPDMRLRFGGEMVYGFGTDGRDAPPDTRAFIMYADCERALGRDWRLGAGLRGYAWRTPGQPDRQDVEGIVRLARVPRGNATLVFLDVSLTPDYQRAVLHLERAFDVDRLRLRPFARLAAGDDLPFGLSFWPGGIDGFPGLASGERRGDRELTLALDASHPIAGPLSFRVLVAAGRTSMGGPILDRTDWLAGARAGVALMTARFGLLRFEYGRATAGYGALFIRLGNL
ncbi:MAG TPA: hypothetical protein VMY76_05460 [Gemmatimonadales bacterium]|nr:hypothetical protein [Gemmatimonadales bacterium]